MSESPNINIAGTISLLLPTPGSNGSTFWPKPTPNTKKITSMQNSLKVAILREGEGGRGSKTVKYDFEVL
jgi:hypothetical protein